MQELPVIYFLLTLTLTHLYPDHLNLYGDTGNLIVLRRRCQWRGIDCTIKPLGMGDRLNPGETDLYFMGGGQDNDQVAVVEDFHQLKADTIQADTEAGVVFLGVCGGYQLMGHTFLMGNGQETPRLGIINVTTKAPGTEVKQRCKPTKKSITSSATASASTIAPPMANSANPCCG